MPTATGLLTAEDFAALPNQGLRLELICGELHAMPPAFADHGAVVGTLHILLGQYIRQQRMGRVYGAETGFLLARNPDTVRAPDLAFIQTSRVTPAARAPQWNPVIPDLVAEVVSSGDRPGDVADKVRMWLAAGVCLVWVVYPPKQEVVVHRANLPEQRLTVNDTLTGQDVVPGFTLPVKALFE